MSSERFVLETDVSRETLGRLEVYESLLKKWNPRINLVAKSTTNDIWNRHIVDSAQALTCAPAWAKSWVDFGTGGGFPGIVVAIMAPEIIPNLQITCIESDTRKAAFLRTVLRETGVKARVVSDRIEKVEPQDADVVSARALAPLSKLLGFAELHMHVSGVALFQKGAEHEKEIQEALETWSFQVDKIPSKTNPNAVILRIGEIERV